MSTTLIDPISWLPEPLQPLWGALQDFPILRALGIALFGLLAAYLVRWIFRSVASRLAGQTKTDVDDQILLHVSRPIFLSVFYGSLCLAMISLGVAEQATSIVVRVLLSLVALVWMVAGFRVSRVLLASLARHKHRFEIVQDRTIPLFDIVSKLLVVLLGSYVILQIWNIDAPAAVQVDVVTQLVGGVHHDEHAGEQVGQGVLGGETHGDTHHPG